MFFSVKFVFQKNEMNISGEFDAVNYLHQILWKVFNFWETNLTEEKTIIIHVLNNEPQHHSASFQLSNCLISHAVSVNATSKTFFWPNVWFLFTKSLNFIYLCIVCITASNEIILSYTKKFLLFDQIYQTKSSYCLLACLMCNLFLHVTTKKKQMRK